MPSNKQRYGEWGEKVAASFLSARGFKIVARNVRTPYGEIDLVAKKQTLLLFVEVKSRSSDVFGLPEEAISSRKREHMIQSAQYYLQESSEIQNDWRIDVIAIRGRPGQVNPEVVWFENAVD
jgi:putative endonuclease